MIISLLLIAGLILFWCSLGSKDPNTKAIAKMYGPKGGWKNVPLLSEKEVEIAKQKWARKQRRALHRKINNNKRR